MSDDLEDVDLSGDPLHIALVLDFVLLQDFNGHLFTSNKVGAQPHFSESALA